MKSADHRATQAVSTKGQRYIKDIRFLVDVAQEDFKQRVRDANDIVDVVGSYVQLKRAGSSYKGLCPFHDDRNPSMTVNPAMQIFKCFVCDEGGDVFSFIQKREGVEFREALEMLAGRAGIAFEQTPEAKDKASLAKSRKMHIFKAQEQAADFFTEQLYTEAGRDAIDYLKKRDLFWAVDEWQIGFAPPGWDGFVSKFAPTPPRERLMVAASLARERESGGVYDFFRNRVMFPIFDTSDRIVGFGGRVLADEEPKYMNTSETAIFNKRALVYGIDRARKPIGKSQTALLVEGYTDVIRCHQHGFNNAVATLGTAFGEEHVRLLKRMGAERVLLVFDADDAGQKAAERSIIEMYKGELGCSVVTLPGGLDPCDFLSEHSPEEFNEALENAKDAFEFKLERVFMGVSDTDLDAKANAARALMELASYSPDPIRRSLLRRRVAERVGVSEATLAFVDVGNKKIRDVTPSAAEGFMPKRRNTGLAANEAEAILSTERAIAVLLACYPEQIDAVNELLDYDELEDELAIEIIESIFEIIVEEKVDTNILLNRLNDDAKDIMVDALAEFDEIKPERGIDKLFLACGNWKRLRLRQALDDIEDRKKQAETNEDMELLRELVMMRREIMQKLNDMRLMRSPS